ncbi:MAG: acyl-CoA dehydrogenase family protein [Dehalococcoidia bacterium]|nr:acyl-CoA dehydrogenase family protein [Dehalococcoidia bacterium]
MDFKFSPTEEAFRQEIREFLRQELGPEYKGRTPHEMFRPDFSQKLGKKGWLGVGWPKEYGGGGRPYMEQLIYSEEMLYNRAPAAAHILGQNMVGPTLISVGSEEHKKKFLPKILSGDVTFCLAYTEPNAGSDLASLQTRAVEQGDYYVVNGQKTFCSFAGQAHYCWLATRTNPDAPKKHRGISIFMLDMETPGITVRNMDTMFDYAVYEVFFDDVKIPKTELVGELNQGWYYITMALDHERVFMAATIASYRRIFEEIVQYAQTNKRNGKPISENPHLRQKLAQLAIDLEVGRVLGYRLAWLLSQGIVPYAEASISKVFTSELERRLANVAMEVMGLYGPVLEGPCAHLDGYMGWEYKFSIMQGVGGGANEIQKIIIALAGLGLPR